MSGRIENGASVRLAYVLKDGDGRLLEERTPETALVYVQGRAEILPFLEGALAGQASGARLRLRVPCADAYGPYDPALLTEMDRSRFPPSFAVVVGAKFNTLGPDGKPIVVRVLEVDDESVSLDGNHPLAGLELIFEIHVLDVSRDASGGESGGVLH